MGYKRQPKQYRLKFEDHPGLEVTAGSINTNDFLELTGLLAQFSGRDAAAAAQATGKVLDLFAAALISWNLEDEGGPVPADRAGIGSQDFDFNLQLIMGWMEAIASVDTPLKQPSPSSPPSGLALSDGMVPLSPSRGS